MSSQSGQIYHQSFLMKRIYIVSKFALVHNVVHKRRSKKKNLKKISLGRGCRIRSSISIPEHLKFQLESNL